MIQWVWYAVYLAFLGGSAWTLDKRARKDATGIANKTRELERKRMKDLAIQFELHAEEPEHVRKLARHMYDTM